MPPLDLAIVCPNIVRADGQGRAMLELARAAAASGHRVTAYARGFDPELSALGVRWVRLGGAPGGQLLFDLAFARQAVRAMRVARHDLACVMGQCAVPEIPYVYYAQFCWHAWQAAWAMIGRPGAYHRVHARFAARRERRALAGARAVITASRRVAAEIGDDQERFSLPRAGVFPVPNGADLDALPAVTPAMRAGARAHLGLDRENFVVAFVGEFNTPRKGLAPLIRAIALGTDERERLVVAGEGRPERLGVSVPAGKVRFLGRVTPVAGVMHAADVVCLPSVYEALSLVTLEAAASGIPLLISDRTGASEHLDGACSIVPAPCAPEALRAALDRLRAEPDAAARTAARARSLAEKLDWRRTAAGAVAVLEDAAAIGVERAAR